MFGRKKFEIIWNSNALSEALGVFVSDNIYASGLHINSKDVTPGSIFIALEGAKSDGHNYVEDALNMGAEIAIVSRMPSENIDPNKIILVHDCFEAINLMAKYKRSKSQAIFLGITGSVGKTSLKEAAKCAFSSLGKTFCSRGNFNNKLGLLINLASMPHDAEYCIFELGMNNSGEMRILSNILSPNIAIINNVYNTHQANFLSTKDIALAKAEILEGLDKENSLVILPRSNEFYSLLESCAKKLRIKNIYSFGKNENSTSMNFNSYTHNVASYSNNLSGQEISIKHNNLPNYHLLNFTPILLSGQLLNLNIRDMAKALESYEIYEGRGNIIHVIKNDFYIIDDSYNSSPSALEASIKYFFQLKLKRKIILLGDMLELGKNEVEEHSKFINIIKNTDIDIVVTYGNLASCISKGLEGDKITFHSNNLADIKHFIKNIIRPKDYILVKASASTKLFEVVTFLNEE